MGMIEYQPDEVTQYAVMALWFGFMLSHFILKGVVGDPIAGIYGYVGIVIVSGGMVGILELDRRGQLWEDC